MKHLPGRISKVYFEPMFITDAGLAEMVGCLFALEQMDSIHFEAKNFSLGETDFFGIQLPKPWHGENFAVIPVKGPLAGGLHPLEKSMGWSDYDEISDWIAQSAEDESVKGIILDFDSPGGSCVGCQEFANRIADASVEKPVVSYTKKVMASAAYYGAVGSNSIVAAHSSIVGSIGTIRYVLDCSEFFKKIGIKAEVFVGNGAKYKGAGAQGTSLTPEHRAMFQAEVDRYSDEFKSHVLTHRRYVSPENMEGQWFEGYQAKANTLIDEVGSFDTAVATLQSLIRQRR